eukprot:TRINITY_DN3257_c0_g1_i1.p2 TRINITY_DN3257_c0_g1~~TRINITY_DN3257_c0_g1_i1.p2  ORF type:complete len:187 (+),score=38.83 TRINITY_DN3257_c0_g1_i1:216-776(+)
MRQLLEKYGVWGDFVIAAFPCNQFGKQEPGTITEIIGFAAKRGFPCAPPGVLFQKCDVNDHHTVAPRWMLPCCNCSCVAGAKDTQHPLWRRLQALHRPPKIQKGPITWNFDKFVIGRDGKVRQRFVGGGNSLGKDEATGEVVAGPELVTAIEAALAEPHEQAPPRPPGPVPLPDCAGFQPQKSEAQ